MSKESYARGLVKAAAAAGVDPTSLAKLAAYGGNNKPYRPYGHLSLLRDGKMLVFPELDVADAKKLGMSDEVANRISAHFGHNPEWQDQEHSDDILKLFPLIRLTKKQQDDVVSGKRRILAQKIRKAIYDFENGKGDDLYGMRVSKDGVPASSFADFALSRRGEDWDPRS